MNGLFVGRIWIDVKYSDGKVEKIEEWYAADSDKRVEDWCHYRYKMTEEFNLGAREEISIYPNRTFIQCGLKLEFKHSQVYTSFEIMKKTIDELKFMSMTMLLTIISADQKI